MTSRLSSNWIVGKRVDLFAFIGGALAAWSIFFMHAALGWDMLMIYVIFITFLDTPHFFGTYLRTYLDREEFRARRTFLLGSLLWILAGPFVLFLSYLLYLGGVAHYLVPFNAFILAVGIWAYWHVVRQHYGFMRLYQAKNGEKGAEDRRRDGWLMHLGLMLPFVVFALRHKEAREAFGLPVEMPAHGWERWVIFACSAGLILLIGDFVLRQARKAARGEPLNLPKLLLFLAVLPLHIIVCYSNAALTAPLVTFSAFVTSYHDIQYHVLVYCHQRNRFKDQALVKSSGLAAILSKNILIFGASALVFGVLVRGLGCSIQLFNGAQCFTPTLVGKVHLFGSVYSDTLLGAVFIGFPCHHYFVDQFIWKPSKDKGLRRDLKLDDPPPQSVPA